MAFVRIKKLKEKEYAYLVENEWTSNGSRQKVKKYLGRVIKPVRIQEEVPAIKDTGFQESVTLLVKKEIENHELEGISIDLENKTFKKANKSIVIAINEGFICEHTLKDALEFKAEGHEEQAGAALATVLLEAGLKLPKDIFVELFEKVYKPKTNPV